MIINIVRKENRIPPLKFSDAVAKLLHDGLSALRRNKCFNSQPQNVAVRSQNGAQLANDVKESPDSIARLPLQFIVNDDPGHSRAAGDAGGAVNQQGFILTGRELDPILDSAPIKWPLSRPPQMLETSLPAVFAVGDIRSDNVKRVASAVGEGSISIHLVHRALAEM